MKKFSAFILAIFMLLCLTACSNEQDIEEQPEKVEEQENFEEFSEPKKVTETETIKIDGIYVDDSYVNDGVPLKMVYVFYTLSAKEENIEIESFFTDMIINDKNTYDSEYDAVLAPASKFTRGYYYSNKTGTLYMGTEGGVLVTFRVPEADLAPGRSIAFKMMGISEADKIRMSTDDIIYCSSPEEVAMKADPDGYEYESMLREEADEETAKIIEDVLNGYYWTYSSYQFEFYNNNKFVMQISSGQSFPGIYSVRKGYIFCEYANTNPVQIHVIPWKINNGSFELDLSKGFDIFE